MYTLLQLPRGRATHGEGVFWTSKISGYTVVALEVHTRWCGLEDDETIWEPIGNRLLPILLPGSLVGSLAGLISRRTFRLCCITMWRRVCRKEREGRRSCFRQLLLPSASCRRHS